MKFCMIWWLLRNAIATHEISILTFDVYGAFHCLTDDTCT